MSLLAHYKNGNYTVMIGQDGTKIRFTKDDEYRPEHPEFIDVKITNKCDIGCPYCYENSTPEGVQGEILYDSFINSLPTGTELCITGGNPLSHPYLGEFLSILKSRNVISRLTLNQKHFMENIEAVKLLLELGYICGVNVSLTNPTEEFINTVKQCKNAVVHVVAGVVTRPQIQSLTNNDIDILICGYKQLRRGKTYHIGDIGVLLETRIQWLKDNIKTMFGQFKSVRFDSLALEQLDIQSQVSPDVWNSISENGRFSMYVDCVKKRFASSSTSDKKYNYTNETVFDMFKKIKEELK